MSLTEQAHQAICAHLDSLGKNLFRFSIDATCGNGYDTLFLAEITEQQVFSFDIQAEAIDNTQQRLNKTLHSEKVMLINQSHTDMLDYCQKHYVEAVGKIDVIIFNLGYLPSGVNQSVMTAADSTIAALNVAVQLLSTHGIISVLCYRGHNGGLSESNAVLQWLSRKKLHHAVVDSAMANGTTPFLLIIKPQAISL